MGRAGVLKRYLKSFLGFSEILQGVLFGLNVRTKKQPLSLTFAKMAF